MNTFRKAYASIDGEKNPSVECYTDGSTCNGRDNIALTKNGLMEWLNESPYDYRFVVDGGIPSVLIYSEPETIIQSSSLWNGEEFEDVYFMHDHCFLLDEE